MPPQVIFFVVALFIGHDVFRGSGYLTSIVFIFGALICLVTGVYSFPLYLELMFCIGTLKMCDVKIHLEIPFFGKKIAIVKTPGFLSDKNQLVSPG